MGCCSGKRPKFPMNSAKKSVSKAFTSIPLNFRKREKTYFSNQDHKDSESEWYYYVDSKASRDICHPTLPLRSTPLKSQRKISEADYEFRTFNNNSNISLLRKRSESWVPVLTHVPEWQTRSKSNFNSRSSTIKKWDGSFGYYDREQQERRRKLAAKKFPIENLNQHRNIAISTVTSKTHDLDARQNRLEGLLLDAKKKYTPKSVHKSICPQ